MAESSNRSLALLLALAAALRLATILAFPSLHHFDENFQLYEQAHRLAFGYGLVPWEFRDGTRSIVPPLLLSFVFRAAEPVFGGPQGYILAARIVLAMLSLAAVAAVYRMAERNGPVHGLLAGLVTASWFQIVYFAGRPLTEAVATTVLLVALPLATAPPTLYTRRRLLMIGCCLGLCLMLRLQLAPGLVVAALWIGRTHWRERWLPMLLGGLAPIVVFGLADWVTWGTPFISYVRAVFINVVLGKASEFGVSPTTWYVSDLFSKGPVAFAVLLTLIAVRARASMMWVAVAVAIIAVHSAIPHKEFRFIIPATACLTVVAALGAADLVERMRGALSPRRHQVLVCGVAACWLAASFGLGFFGSFRDHWYTSRDVIAAETEIARAPNLCGVRFLQDWWTTGGYAFLHRDVPVFAGADEGAPTAAYNMIVVPSALVSRFTPRFRMRTCVADSLCIMERDGPCTPAPEWDLRQKVL